MKFSLGPIDDVIIKDLRKYVDNRGWLCELFRFDEVQSEHLPVMSYISVTYPGITRGPHEHAEQTDYFCFLGPSNFKLCLWDNRKKSKTYCNMMIKYFGEDYPAMVIVPPGIVHGYKNTGAAQGTVINFPNKLFAGEKRKEPVDEIRHEDDPNSPFRID
jgi:dTDP-4-dehydrorhamnose 3,5-epimerase